MKILRNNPTISKILIFFVFQGIKSIKNTNLFFFILPGPIVSFRLKSIRSLLFCLQIMFQVIILLFNSFSKTLLRFKKLLEWSVISFFWCFWLKSTLCINLALLFFLKLTYFTIFISKLFAHLLSNSMLLLFKKTNSFLFFNLFLFNQPLKVHK